MINLSVVIVDDDLAHLDVLKNILEFQIKDIYTFSDSTEALENIKIIKPDIIISDINMPEMSGIYMYKKLKEQGYDIPIILATAGIQQRYFIEAIKLKVKSFLIKPIDLRELVRELIEFEKELDIKKELNQKEEMFRMQSKLAALGEMLGNISHQWKQPLNTISSAVVNLQMKKELDELTDNKYMDKVLKSMEDSILYMNDTMNDFQNYLKPNSVPQEFFIEDTINKVESLVSSQLKASNIKIKKDIDNFKINNFQNDLIQVLINLKTNAIDELKKKDDEKILLIKSFEKGNKHYLEIHDNAGGVPEEIEDKIFEPFFTTKDETGTGIGLYMSKQITENRLNSKINLSNEEFIYKEKSYFGAKFLIELNAY